MSYDLEPESDFDDDADTISNDIPRDEWRRPRIYPKPGAKKTHQQLVAEYAAKGKLPGGYRRVTKFIGIIDDRYNIERWGERMVALGMGQREDLCHAAASLTAEKKDRDDLQIVATKAKNHARADSKATKGTATHKLCERLDSGEQLNRDQIPKAVLADLDAYVEVRDKAGLRYNLIERLRVFDPWRIAGTPDRTGWVNGKNSILDLKTGDLEWSEAEIAMQLAAYAYSVPYSQQNGREEEDPPVRRDKAFVIHLPTGQAKCELYEVDIQRGWEKCQLAAKVWDARKDNKGIFLPFEPGEVIRPPGSGNNLDWRADTQSIIDKVFQINTRDELLAFWNSITPGLCGPREREAFAKRAEQLG